MEFRRINDLSVYRISQNMWWIFTASILDIKKKNDENGSYIKMSLRGLFFKLQITVFDTVNTLVPILATDESSSLSYSYFTFLWTRYWMSSLWRHLKFDVEVKIENSTSKCNYLLLQLVGSSARNICRPRSSNILTKILFVSYVIYSVRES